MLSDFVQDLNLKALKYVETTIAVWNIFIEPCQQQW